MCWIYFSCVEMVSNFALRVVPIALTVAIITTEMPAAIRPYSIAVAPELVFQKSDNLRHLSNSCEGKTMPFSALKKSFGKRHKIAID